MKICIEAILINWTYPHKVFGKGRWLYHYKALVSLLRELNVKFMKHIHIYGSYSYNLNLFRQNLTDFLFGWIWSDRNSAEDINRSSIKIWTDFNKIWRTFILTKCSSSQSDKVWLGPFFPFLSHMRSKVKMMVKLVLKTPCIKMVDFL